MEFPFAPEGWPRHLAGKKAVEDYMRGYPERIDLQEIPQPRIHQTAAPETILVELRGVGRVVNTGNPFDMTTSRW